MKDHNTHFKIALISCLLPVILLLGQTHPTADQIETIRESYRGMKSDPLPEKPQLVDYERILIESNPSIHASYFTWQVEVKKIAVARGLPDPKISFGYFLENIETAVGPQEYKIGVMQMIPWLGKLIAQGNIQSLKAQAAYQKLQAEINRQLLNLHLRYYDFYYLEKAISITKQNIDLVKNWEQVILSKYKTDMAGHANLIKTQIEAVKLEDDLKTFEAKRLPLIQRFIALLNLSELDKIQIADSLAYHPLSYTQEALTTLVLENNPNLKQLDLMQQAAGKGVSRAKMNWLPDFSVGIDKIYTGNKWNATGQPVPESGKDPIVVMGSMNIPLWFYKQSAGVGAARHQERRNKAKVVEKLNMIQVTFETIWFELNDAERKIILYRDFLIPKSLESLRASEKAYISGTADFINIIDAQRRFLQFQLAHEGALVRHRKAVARLEALAGRSL